MTFTKWIIWNLDRWSNMHAQGHVKQFWFWLYRSAAINLYHKWSQRSGDFKGMMQSEYLDSCSQCCTLETRRDCSATPKLLLVLAIHHEAKEPLTSAGTAQHLAEGSGNISFDFPGFHGSVAVWKYCHAEREAETGGLLSYVMTRTRGRSWKRVCRGRPGSLHRLPTDQKRQLRARHLRA